MVENFTMKICNVVSNEDDTGQGLIKVFLGPSDNIRKTEEGTDEKNIQTCFPLLPRMFGVIPKEKDKVFVYIINGQRYYIGPLVGQYSNLGDTSSLETTAGLQGADTNPGENPENNIDISGCLPEKDDVSINGKGCSGIYVKKNDIILHSGLKVVGGKGRIHQNTSADEAVVQISYNKDGNPKSSITMFANNINLFGNGAGQDKFDPSLMHKKGKHVISQEDLFELHKMAQSVPYGEKLCAILLKIIAAIMNHTHPYPCLPPFQVGEVAELSKYLVKKEGSGNENLNIADKWSSSEDNTELADEILSKFVKVN